VARKQRGLERHSEFDWVWALVGEDDGWKGIIQKDNCCHASDGVKVDTQEQKSGSGAVGVRHQSACRMPRWKRGDVEKRVKHRKLASPKGLVTRFKQCSRIAHAFEITQPHCNEALVPVAR